MGFPPLAVMRALALLSLNIQILEPSKREIITALHIGTTEHSSLTLRAYPAVGGNARFCVNILKYSNFGTG